jgi:hypothetical protein
VRIYVDYRGINNILQKSLYVILLIKETVDSICKVQIFKKHDVITMFNRVHMIEGHEWCMTFIIWLGVYEGLVIPFGLQKAPATF